MALYLGNNKVSMSSVLEGTGAVENFEWHQCPEAVRNFLANVTYDPSDYSTSQIANYAPATAVVSNYRPIGKTLGGKTYYNQVPGVETPFAATGKAGTLKSILFQIRHTTGMFGKNLHRICFYGVN